LEKRYCRWVEEHRGLLFRVVHASERSADDQGDLFQETLFQLWKSMPAFEGKCKETTWIYRVALNTARAWRRSERRRKERHEAIVSFTSLHGAGTEANPLLEQLYEAIRQLSKAEGALLLLHLDGLSYEEMSEVLGVSAGCIGVRLTRARKQLAEKMKGDGNGI